MTTTFRFRVHVPPSPDSLQITAPLRTRLISPGAVSHGDPAFTAGRQWFGMRHGIRPAEEAGPGSTPRRSSLCVAPTTPRRAPLRRRQRRGYQDKLRRLLWYAQVGLWSRMGATVANYPFLSQTATSMLAPVPLSSCTFSASLPIQTIPAALLPLFSPLVFPQYTPSPRVASMAHGQAYNRSSFYRA